MLLAEAVGGLVPVLCENLQVGLVAASFWQRQQVEAGVGSSCSWMNHVVADDKNLQAVLAVDVLGGRFGWSKSLQLSAVCRWRLEQRRADVVKMHGLGFKVTGGDLWRVEPLTPDGSQRLCLDY